MQQKKATNKSRWNNKKTILRRFCVTFVKIFTLYLFCDPLPYLFFLLQLLITFELSNSKKKPI